MKTLYFILAALGVACLMVGPITVTSCDNAEHKLGTNYPAFQNTMVWPANAASPTISQPAVGALATEAGTGDGGVTITIVAQPGQAATGPAGNGGNGGSVALVSGTGGTSVDGSAGVAGSVILGLGGAEGGTFIVGPTAEAGGPAGLGLASAAIAIDGGTTQTIALTPAQYLAPLVLLSGTLTVDAGITLALPAANAVWFFDDSQVTFTAGSINWTCGGGSGSSLISSQSAPTSNLILVSCRGTAVSITQ